MVYDAYKYIRDWWYTSTTHDAEHARSSYEPITQHQSSTRPKHHRWCGVVCCALRTPRTRAHSILCVLCMIIMSIMRMIMDRMHTHSLRKVYVEIHITQTHTHTATTATLSDRQGIWPDRRRRWWCRRCCARTSTSSTTQTMWHGTNATAHTQNAQGTRLWSILYNGAQARAQTQSRSRTLVVLYRVLLRCECVCCV